MAEGQEPHPITGTDRGQGKKSWSVAAVFASSFTALSVCCLD